MKEYSAKEETLKRSPAGKNPARQSMEPCSRKRVMRSQPRGWHEALTVSTEGAGLSHESINAGVFAVYPAGTVREVTRKASRRPSCRGPRPWQRCMKREPCELGNRSGAEIASHISPKQLLAKLLFSNGQRKHTPHAFRKKRNVPTQIAGGGAAGMAGLLQGKFLQHRAIVFLQQAHRFETFLRFVCPLLRLTCAVGHLP